MTTFKLPDLGEGLQEAEIVSWHVAVGDRIVADQPLLSVETDKAVVEVPSPWSGRVTRIYDEAGAIVTVGAALADIETEGTTADEGTVVGRLPPDMRQQSSAPPRQAPAERGPAVKASPAVRARARELGVSLDRIVGTGPGGLVTRDDVEAAGRTREPAPGYEALRGVRRAMAEAVARSAAQVAAATVTDEAIIDAWTAGSDPTIRLVRAIAAGCQAAPALNAWLDGDRQVRRVHDNIDLALAMETEDGLFAPVLRNVAERDDADLRRGLDALKRDVTTRSVPPGELRDPTITLSNFGMLGGLHAALTIVPPQVAILGAGRIHMSPRVIDGDIRAARVVPLSLTFDHRGATGAEAIAFLNAVIEELQKP